MRYLPNPKMWPNKFEEVTLPTKRQIFARTGQRSVSPSGQYTKDDPARFGKTPTESANEFTNTAEAYERPKEDMLE